MGIGPGISGLTLQPGSYLVQSTVQVANSAPTPLTVTRTQIDSEDPSRPGGKDVKTVTVPAAGSTEVFLQQIHQYQTAGPAQTTCDGGTWNGLMIALRVGLTHEIR